MNSALKLVNEIILYYDAQRKKYQINLHYFMQNFKIFQSLEDSEVNKAPVTDGKVGR